MSPDHNSEWALTLAQYPERYGALSKLFLELLEDYHWLSGESSDYRTKFDAINSPPKPIDTTPEPGYDPPHAKGNGVNQSNEE